MKILSKFSIILILVSFLFVGCGGDDDDDLIGPGGAALGLSAMSPGDWAEHRSPEGDRDISKYLGEDTWQGQQCILIEMESYYDAEVTIVQMWMDKVTGEAVLFLIEMDGEVMSMDLSTPPDVPGEDEPWEDPKTQKIGTEKYTTPTGKTVEATVYQTQTTYGLSEDWVSSEVPFNSVKSLIDGRLESSLYNYGGGATRSITRQEAENAKPFGFPTIPGGNDPVTPDPGTPVTPDPDTPVVPDPGIVGGGGVVITVGQGARPTITVSEPVQYLSIMIGFIPVWGFESPEDPGDPAAASFAGPFKYGVVPNGAKDNTDPNPPDLVAGQTYTIQVIAWKGLLPTMGSLTFTR